MSEKKEEKRGRGRPVLRPTIREEALRKANELLQKFISGEINDTEAAVRRKINLLGENSRDPLNRWFTYTQKSGENPSIKNFQSSTPNLSNIKSHVKEQMGETLQDQVDLEKIQAQIQARQTRHKQRNQSSSSSSSSLISASRDTPQQKEFDWGSIVMDPDNNEEIPPLAVESKTPPIESKTPQAKRQRTESKYDTVAPIQRRGREIHELINSTVEDVEGIDDLNQNVSGINEREALSYIDDMSSSIMRQAQNFLLDDEEEKRQYSLSNTSNLLQYDDNYDMQQFRSPSTREASMTTEVMRNRANDITSRERFNLIPEVKESMRGVAVQSIQQIAESVGMNLPSEVLNMGIEGLQGILKSADIKVDIEDVKDALSSSGISNLDFDISNNPFYALLESSSNALANEVPVIKKTVDTIKNVSDMVPESIRKKVIEAGGSLLDSVKFPERKERKERKEEKDGKEGEAQPSIVRDIFGRISSGGGGGEPPSGGGEPNRTEPIKDPRSAIVDEINSINMRLEEMSKGGKLNYPEERKTKAYRFPRPDENYNAVQLVQNATTNYLNDLNMYGTTFNDDI